MNLYNNCFFPLIRRIKFRLRYRFRIMGFDQTIEYIKSTHCSIARFGDGEFGLITKSNHPDFQDNDVILSKRLQEVCNSNDERLLVCIPHNFVSTNDCTDFAKKFWDWWLWDNNNSIKVATTLNLNPWKTRIFGDAQITRPYMDWKDKGPAEKRFFLLKSLWDKQDIVIVEGENTKIGVGNDLLNNAKSIVRIIAPGKNAFSVYNKILQQTIETAQNRLVLIALGPTATVLAYDLSQNNIQALDIGHIDIEYEWFRQGVQVKTPINGKEVQELHLSGNVSGVPEIQDQEYTSQIIVRIKGE